MPLPGVGRFDQTLGGFNKGANLPGPSGYGSTEVEYRQPLHLDAAVKAIGVENLRQELRCLRT